MTDIYFVRHAESFGNLSRRAYGWYDGILTPKGYAQIEKLRERFEGIHIDEVYSSDLLRTCETAKAIYEPKGLTLKKEPAFREISLGAWEDRPWGELLPKYKEAYEAWVKAPLDFYVEGSETYAEVYARAREALEKIVSENEGKSIAIVSHGATIRMLMHGLRNNGNLENVASADWGDNTCISHFRFDGEKYIEVFLNCNDHLKTLYGFADGLSWVREGGGKNVWFKSATKDDIEKIKEYRILGEKEVFGRDTKNLKPFEKRVERFIKKDAESIVFGYLLDEEVGIIELDIAANVYPKAGHISFIYLKPEHRRRRFGIQLIGHAMSKYKALGRRHLSIRVAETNTAAYEFYKKYGFYEIIRENDGGIIQRVMLLDI